MCKCGHGADRHYLDYAGPGVCGGILGKCLEKNCPCTLLVWNTVTMYAANVTYSLPTVTWPVLR